MGRAETAKTKSPLARIAQPEARALQRAGRVMVLANLMWLGQAALVAWLVGRLAAGTGSAGAVVFVVAGFAALGIVRAGLEYRAGAQVFGAAERLKAMLRRRLVAREARADTLAPRPLGSAAIAALASEKTEALGPYLTRYAPARLRAVIVPLAILLVVFPVSWAVGMILLVAGPLIPVFMALVGMAAKEASEKQMVQISSLNDSLMERLSALADIQLLDAGDRVAADFETEADNLRERTMAVLRVAFLSSTVLELFAAIGVAMVAVFVGFTLLGEIGFGSWGGLSAGEGVFVLLLAPEFFQPMRDLAAAWHDKAAADAVAQEFETLEAEAPPAILGAGLVANPLSGAPDISVKNLVLSWPDGSVQGVPDFEVKAGQSLAVTGASGVGKSSLLAVLAGMEQPGAGVVRVAGHVLGDETADQWRQSLGWIPQSPHFLNASLRHNITFGAQDPARLARALDEAAFGNVVARLPRGLDTRLGETGAGLSGGEARRATIARALFDAPGVVLADEPTADLDPETAAQVIAGLRALSARGASVIVATHDPALVAAMDGELVLEGGA